MCTLRKRQTSHNVYALFSKNIMMAHIKCVCACYATIGIWLSMLYTWQCLQTSSADTLCLIGTAVRTCTDYIFQFIPTTMRYQSTCTMILVKGSQIKKAPSLCRDTQWINACNTRKQFYFSLLSSTHLSLSVVFLSDFSHRRRLIFKHTWRQQFCSKYHTPITRKVTDFGIFENLQQVEMQ